MNIFAAPVLAGAYRGRALDDRALLLHAVCDEAFELGRLKRGRGEAFCAKAIDTADSGTWEPSQAITCTRCIAVVRRLAASGHAR